MRLFDRKSINFYVNNHNMTPEPETVSYYIKKKFNVQEVQVSMQERVAGESYLNFSRSIQYMIRVVISVIVFQPFRKWEIMSFYLRIILILGSLWTIYYVASQVRKGKIEINHSLFWVLFSIFLFLTSIFPQYIIILSKIFKIQSPSNVVFLVIIFILIIKLFSNSVEMSKLEGKIESIVQESALKELENETDDKK